MHRDRGYQRYFPQSAVDLMINAFRGGVVQQTSWLLSTMEKGPSTHRELDINNASCGRDGHASFAMDSRSIVSACEFGVGFDWG
jgi:hypothetical protein